MLVEKIGNHDECDDEERQGLIEAEEGSWVSEELVEIFSSYSKDSSKVDTLTGCIKEFTLGSRGNS